MKQRKLTPRMARDFLKALRAEDRSPGTVEKYARDIAAFSAWLGDRPASREEAAGWRDSLLARGYAPVTVNSMTAALNALFRFLGWGDCRVKALRLQRSVFRSPDRELTRQEYYRLVEAARALGRPRLALLLETICATGIRVGEVKYITLEAARRGRAEVFLKGKFRTVLIPGKLARKLVKYCRKEKIPEGPVFRTRQGKSLDRRQIWSQMKALCSRARVDPGKVFPHNLRHLFARAFYQATRDVARLADILGHSSLETTRIYLVTTGAEHARQLQGLRLIC